MSAVMQGFPEAISNLKALSARVCALFAPPDEITVSEWARRYRILPRGTSARPGPFVPETYQVEMMDCILNPNIHEIVDMKSTQIGYSDAVLNNIIGYIVDVDPKPIMLVQPTIENSKDYGKKKIAPMIQACKTLREKVREPTSRRSGNTLSLKEFPGGFLKLTGANSGTGLRSDAVPIVLFDEIDAYPLDVDGEGDPLEIGARRTDTFADFKIVKGSTPAKPKGFSRIERDYDRSDRRRFHVKCPLCECPQVFWWRDPITKEYRIIYQVDDAGNVVPDSVRYVCAGCKAAIPERYKQQMLNGGRWIAEFPGRSVAGFHINALYSPWRDNWHAMAQEWVNLNRSKNPDDLKAFINLRLGETWEEAGDAIEGHVLKARLESYRAEVPTGVGVLSASVDVQNDRLEAIVKGWGAGEESWLVAYQQFFGDPGRDEVWLEVDEFIRGEFEHESGRKVRIGATMVDSGGHHTDSVYRFAKARMAQKVFALKGSSEHAKEILGRFTLNNQYRVKLFSIGTDTAKDRIFSRLRIPTKGPGYIHLPDWLDDEYLEQLTSEKAITRYKRGRGMVREYVKMRARNEALDLEVYALAALYVQGNHIVRNLARLAEELAVPLGPPKDPEPGGGGQGGPAAPGWQTGASGGSGWVNSW